MIFNGTKVGVNMFPGGKIEWFSDPKAAARVEKEEVEKFAAWDRVREAKRIKALGITETPRSYSVSLSEQQPGRKPSRRVQ